MPYHAQSTLLCLFHFEFFVNQILHLTHCKRYWWMMWCYVYVAWPTKGRASWRRLCIVSWREIDGGQDNPLVGVRARCGLFFLGVHLLRELLLGNEHVRGEDRLLVRCLMGRLEQTLRVAFILVLLGRAFLECRLSQLFFLDVVPQLETWITLQGGLRGYCPFVALFPEAVHGWSRQKWFL